MIWQYTNKNTRRSQMPKNQIILNIEPKAKPQGTPNFGKVWQGYFDWRDRFVNELLNKRLAFEDLPIPFEVRFFVSKGYNKKSLGKPRTKTPDYDNYLKAFTDGWFGGFEKINNINYDDGIVWGGYGLKYHSPVAFIEVVPARFPEQHDILQSINSQL